MTTLRKQILIGMTAFGIGLGAVAVQAAPGERGGEGRHEQMKQRMEQRIEQRSADLRAKLNLNAGQEQAWNNYVAAMKPGPAGERKVRPSREEMAKLSAPERLARMHERMKQGEQRMAGRVAATRDFYAVLTPEQRKVFDENFRVGHRHHGKGRHRKS